MGQLYSIGRHRRRNEANISAGIFRWSSIDRTKRGIRSTVVNHRCRRDASIRWHRSPVFVDISAGFEGGTKEIGTVGRSSTKCILVSRLKVARSCVTKRRIVPSAKSHVLHSWFRHRGNARARAPQLVPVSRPSRSRDRPTEKFATLPRTGRI